MQHSFWEKCGWLFFYLGKTLNWVVLSVFMEPSTFLISMKNPSYYPIKCFARLKKITNRIFKKSVALIVILPHFHEYIIGKTHTLSKKGMVVWNICLDNHIFLLLHARQKMRRSSVSIICVHAGEIEKFPKNKDSFTGRLQKLKIDLMESLLSTRGHEVS